MSVARTPEAESDLSRYAREIARTTGLRTAHKFIDRYGTTSEMIDSQTQMGSRLSDSNPLLHGIRCFPIKGFPNHIVVYQPRSEGGIHLLRILHAAMDLESALERSLDEFASDPAAE